MLQKLLTELEQGGTQNPAILATRLGVSPVLVEMMLEDLERKGILTRLPTGACGGESSACARPACNSCPVSTTCAPHANGQSRVWMLAGRS